MLFNFDSGVSSIIFTDSGVSKKHKEHSRVRLGTDGSVGVEERQ